MASEQANARGLERRTAESNAAFAAMTPAQKRVRVAQDVIDAVRAKQIVPTEGSYMAAWENKRDPWAARNLLRDMRRSDPDASLQDVLPDLPPCHACAKGAVLICAVARQNKVTLGQTGGENFPGEVLSRVLDGLFSPQQLALMELEFEGTYLDEVELFPTGDDDFDPPEAVMDLGEMDEDKRMIAIMQNVVDNGGTFVPRAPEVR